MIICYGLVPFAGALVRRYKWFSFRRCFDELRLHPLLDYCSFWRQDKTGVPEIYRFTGVFESVTDGQTLWIRSNDLTVPVSLKNAKSYILLAQKDEHLDEAPPEKIRWEKVSTLTEGARVFVGGPLEHLNGRRTFVSLKENPLIIIFYDGSDNTLTNRVIRSGRWQGEYLNSITPYSLAIGALCQILMALNYQSRIAYRLTVIVSLIALFIPLYPIIPPGLLFTLMYRRLSGRARALRAYGDIARLPLRYLTAQKGTPKSAGPLRECCSLPGGESYGYVRYQQLPPEVREKKIPFLLPRSSKVASGDSWYVFGALQEEQAPGSQVFEPAVVKPQDPFATFGILPGNPGTLARRYTVRAYLTETVAWIFLLVGIGINILFVRTILALLGVTF